MKNKVIVGLLVVGLISFAWMEMVYLPSQENAQEEESLKQLDPKTHNFEKVLKYENLYMGNAGNTLHLFGELPLRHRLESFEMDSDKFLLIVKYNNPESESERMVQQSVIYNSTAAFVLIKNVEQVEMRFPNQTFIVDRTNVEKWFSTEFVELINPIEFQKKVQEPMIDGSLEIWLEAYTE